MQHRQDHEPPSAIAQRGWRYHHLGIPTTTPRPQETYLAQLKMYVSGFETSPYGVEWMRFEPDCPVSGLCKRFRTLRLKLTIWKRHWPGRRCWAR